MGHHDDGRGVQAAGLIQRIPQSSIAEITLDDDNQIETFVQYLYDRMMIRRWQTFHIVVGQGQWGSGALADVASLGLKYLNLQAPTFDAYEMNVRDIHDFYIPAEHISRKSAIYQAIAEFVGSPRKYSNVRHILPSEPHEAVGATDIKLAPAAKRFEAMQRQVPIQHNDRLARTEYELALALSAQSMVLGGDKVGSYALAKEESNMLYQAIYGTLQRMGDEIEAGGGFALALEWVRQAAAGGGGHFRLGFRQRHCRPACQDRNRSPRRIRCCRGRGIGAQRLEGGAGRVGQRQRTFRCLPRTMTMASSAVLRNKADDADLGLSYIAAPAALAVLPKYGRTATDNDAFRLKLVMASGFVDRLQFKSDTDDGLADGLTRYPKDTNVPVRVADAVAVLAVDLPADGEPAERPALPSSITAGEVAAEFDTELATTNVRTSDPDLLAARLGIPSVTAFMLLRPLLVLPDEPAPWNTDDGDEVNIITTIAGGDIVSAPDLHSHENP